ncbi:MAG TPA: S8 family serine peptidase [Planctomycetota bacterium]|nr:S8 family serine peptidase [Planctomycetota bacterium]
MNTTILRSLLLFGAAAASCPAQAPSATQTPAPAPAPLRSKPVHYRIPNGWNPHVLAVKFRDGLTVRLRDGSLTDLGTNALGAARPVLERLQVGTWSRAHAVSEAELDRLRALGERNVGHALHDLNLVFRCRLPENADTEALIDALNALDCVELAEAVPGLAPPPQAPDLRFKQGYSEPAPRGTGAGSFQGLSDLNPFANLAARGGSTRIADIEYGFDPAHVDLPPVAMLTPPGYSTPAWDDHGTAVLGVLAATLDAKGTTGMAPSAQISFASAADPFGTSQIDNAITLAGSAVGTGGIVLLEQQIAGPHYVGPPGSQAGLVPVEWNTFTRMAIENVVATGVIVVEAAGNGSENLDHPIYGGWFSIAQDSGALIVGAGVAPPPSVPLPPTPPLARSRMWFSNYGETLDLQGWGERVVTTGYGDLYPGGPSNDSYTAVFGGTSSASAIVAGACGLLQSLHFERRMYYLTPYDLRAALRRSGTPQTGDTSQNIGPLPDLMRTAVELHIYDDLGIAHGFDPGLPGIGGNGLEFTGWQTVNAMAVFDDDGPGSHEKRLYVAGQFAKFGGRPVNNIACWNGVGWEELGGGLAGPVLTLAVHDADGAGPGLPVLCAGGLFPGGVAYWNGTAWGTLGGLSPGGVRTLVSVPGFGGATLVAGGDFTTAGGTPVNHVARWTGTWSPLGAGLDGPVAALAVWNGQLVAGGAFQHSGLTTARSLAGWNGAAWSELGGGTGFSGGTVECLASIPIANSTSEYLVVGGTFSAMGGVPVATLGLAVWNGLAWYMPGTPASTPFAITGFEDGSDPQLPRQVDAYLAGPTGLFRLDLTTGYAVPLAVQSNTARCLLAFDEDGAGVEQPSLLIGGDQFWGPAASFGIAKHFGATPNTLTGIEVIVPTGCGGIYQPSIRTTGRPVLGSPFTIQFDCLPMSLPAFVAGLPQPFPIPLCGGNSCAIGVDPIAIDFATQSKTYNLPNYPAFVGVELAFQGIEFVALPYGPTCIPPFLPVNLRTTDTLRLTF